MNTPAKREFPEKLFLRDHDLADLNWDGAEGDVHAINIPAAQIITRATPYVPESLLEAEKKAHEETKQQVAGLRGRLSG